MSKYIGTPVVSLSTDTVDVTGDITTTDATPEVIIVNDTHEDTDGGREGKLTFKGQASGGEETTLAQIQASHDGTSDDEKGDLIFKVNDGSDGSSPTERLRIGSDGATTITTEGNEDTLVLKSNDADANAGPKLQFNRNSASPADDDLLGEIRFDGRNDAGQAVEYAKISSTIQDASDGTEDIRLSLKSIVAGTERERITIQPTEVVFNEDSQDLDFRVESDGNATAFKVDASGQGTIMVGGVDVFSYGQTSGNGLLGYAIDNGSSYGSLMLSNNADRGWSLCYANKFAYSNGDDRRLFALNINGGGVGLIQTNTAGTAIEFTASSDRRRKENITDLTNGIETVKQLRPRAFEWITDEDTVFPANGFIADEADRVIPEWVTGEANAVDEDNNPIYQTMDYSKAVPVLTAALKEAIAKIETLETKVAALEGE